MEPNRILSGTVLPAKRKDWKAELKYSVVLPSGKTKFKIQYQEWVLQQVHGEKTVLQGSVQDSVGQRQGPSQRHRPVRGPCRRGRVARPPRQRYSVRWYPDVRAPPVKGQVTPVGLLRLDQRLLRGG